MMHKTAAELTLIEAIAVCAEKDECFDGWTPRQCPMPDEQTAIRKFDAWVEEATRWMGEPQFDAPVHGRRAAWPHLRLKQSGRGIGVWVRAETVWTWWQEDALWKGDPMAQAGEWEPEDDPLWNDA